MAQMDAEIVDLTVTSPPYDEMRDYKGYEFDFEAIARGLLRVTKPGGVVVWVVGDQRKKGSESGTSFRQALFFKKIGFNLHDTMLFTKPPRGAVGSGKYVYRQCFEYMFVFSKGSPKTVNLIKDHRNKIRRNAFKFKIRNKDGTFASSTQPALDEYSVRTNMWEYCPGNNTSTKDRVAYQHPAIFPEKLAYDHIISWSDPGDLVFDPMSGSGTTCKAAKCAGRNYIGVDISAEYNAIAQQRLDAILL